MCHPTAVGVLSSPFTLTLDAVIKHPFVRNIRQPSVWPRMGRAKYAVMSTAKLQKLQGLYQAVHHDQAAFLNARLYTQELTRDSVHNPVREQIVAARVRLLKGLAPRSPLEESVAWLLDTRRERWTRLSALLGIPIPDYFELFRGNYGLESVKWVLDHWINQEHTDLPVMQHSLASWSLSQPAARRFMRRGPHAVLYQAQVHFDDTFADLLVDDGGFLVPYQNQWEVLAGPPDEGLPLFAQRGWTRVRLNGREYRYEERELLFQAYTSARQAGTIS